MSSQDVLVDSTERGWAVAVSEMERTTLLNMLKIFKDALLAEMRDDDVAGVMATTYVIRGGDTLSSGVVLVLEDRALIGWMKGLFKKPVVEVVPMSSISEVTRGVREPDRCINKANRAIYLRAAQDWELLCNPTDMAEEPVFDLVAGLLAGTLKIDDLRPVGDAARS